MTNLIPKKWLCCLSLLVLFCVLPFASTISVGAQPTQKVEMSIEQFNNLREMVNELQTQSQTQKMESQKLKTQLTESQEALTKAQVYLTDYKQNLTELQKQTDSMRRSEKRMERQRNIAWIIAGSLLVWGVSK